MSEAQTYTTADRALLAGSGDIDDWLLYRLTEMAEYDQQSATVTIDREDQSVTITQTPHQGDDHRARFQLPICQLVETWLDAAERRASNAEVFDYSADQVASIREDIRASRGADIPL